MSKFKDLTGLKFNRLFVLKFTEFNSVNKAKFLCLCECGKIKIVEGRYLINNKIKSCGCMRTTHANDLSRNRVTHGQSKNPIYQVRIGMINRCYNVNCKEYKYYGLKGVSVCRDWLTSFECFYDWCIKNGYKKGLQIDRFPNRDGNYEPSNCRFATPKQNCNNKNNNVRLTVFGITKTVCEWAEIIGIPVYKIRYRIKNNAIGVNALFGNNKTK